MDKAFEPTPIKRNRPTQRARASRTASGSYTTVDPAIDRFTEITNAEKVTYKRRVSLSDLTSGSHFEQISELMPPRVSTDSINYGGYPPALTTTSCPVQSSETQQREYQQQ